MREILHMKTTEDKLAHAKTATIEKYTILIVEDDRALSELVGLKLRREGYEIKQVFQGREGITSAIEMRPELILLDYSLPDMTAAEVIKHLTDQGVDLPFIIMTAHQESKMAVEMMKMGAKDYLVKEGNYLELLPQVVNQVMNQIVAQRNLVEAEMKLQASERQYRSLFERDVAGNYHTTLDGAIIDCNQAFARIFGYSNSEEILKINAAQLYFHHGDRERFIKNLQNDGVLRNYEACMRRKDGNPVWILESVVLFAEDGQIPSYIQGTMIDITDRKKTEEALRVSEELNRGIVNTAPIGIMYLDKFGKVLYENPVMANILGYTIQGKETYRDQNVLEIPIIRESSSGECIEKLLEGNMVLGEQVKCQTSGGGQKILQIHAAPRRGVEGEVVGAVFMVLDTTDYCQLEEQYLQSQKMEAIGQLAGGIAHDFNNLLMAIAGHTELALLKLSAEDPIKKTFQEIRKSTDRAAQLTGQLLTFSRKQLVKPQIINCNTVISNMQKMLLRIIGEDVELLTVPADKLHSIQIDPGQLEQIILNLAVNARDAMPQGGKLIIETRNVLLTEKDIRLTPDFSPGNYAVLSISDTGIGMNEEVKARIFEPFFTTKGLGKGTGLGLATVYGIVKQNNGYIRVFSEPDKGTRFEIYFPKIAGQAVEIEKTEETTYLPRGTETVLVAEDEEIIRDLACKILKQQGYHVIEAKSGIDALLLCRQLKNPINLLITDVIMPKMNGADLVNHLRKIWSDFKVLFMSGYTPDVIVKNGILKPGTPYMQKPFQLSTLAKKVREVLDAY